MASSVTSRACLRTMRSLRSSSPRQPHASQQVIEPRVCAEGVNPRIHFELVQSAGMLSVCLLQPVEGLILLAESGMDESDVNGRDIASPGQFPQLSDYLPRLSSLT